MRITGLYLAAGHSKRMGKDKLSLPFGNQKLGFWALDKILHSHLNEVIVITNQANLYQYKKVVDEKRKMTVIEASGNNQSDSIKAGLDKAIQLQSDAIIIVLADQPFISIKMMNQLIDIYKQDRAKAFVAPLFNGSMRPPIVLSKKLFPALHKLKGDQGAKQILINKRQEGVLVPFSDSKLFVDIDRIDEYLFWKQNIK